MAKATTTSAAAPAQEQEQEQGAPALDIPAIKHDAALLAAATREGINEAGAAPSLQRYIVSIFCMGYTLGACGSLPDEEAEEAAPGAPTDYADYLTLGGLAVEYANVLTPQILAALNIPAQPDQALIRSVVHETLDQIKERGQAAKAKAQAGA